ncbi:MAG: DUF3240 family protein [Gammaproteobacteria bacterium]
MNSPDCCLTLVFPKALEENLVDFLLEHEALAGEFTTSLVEGHGSHIDYQNIAERVRGRARRVQMNILLQRASAQTLINDLRGALPHTDIVYWITPISEFGSFA